MTKDEYTQFQSLDDILQNARLTPMFQPIVSIKENNIYGYEALIRGPSDSPLHSPINLFDAASRHGRLAELDLLCREVAITQFGLFELYELIDFNTIKSAGYSYRDGAGKAYDTYKLLTKKPDGKSSSPLRLPK